MGVDTIFGLHRRRQLYMADSFHAGTGGVHRGGAEASAVLAAAGYSRTTGRFGVAASRNVPP